MSCEYRRRKFLGLLLGGGDASKAPSAQVAVLERVYQQAYDAARARREEQAQQGQQGQQGQQEPPLPEDPELAINQELENRRKTHLLFANMLRMGVSLPVHSASGLPKSEAQAGYAALWDVLKARLDPDHLRTAIATAAATRAEGPFARSGIGGSSMRSLSQANRPTPLQTHGDWEGPWLPGDGDGNSNDPGDSYDAEGYDKEGYDRSGIDRHGFDRAGFKREASEAQSFDRYGYDADGRDRKGYDKDGYNRDGYNRRGFDKEGRDRWGYDWTGFDRAGFDRTGYNKYGYNRAGFDKDGYDREGYNKKGYNRRGYDRQGLNARGVDRFGYDARGFKGGFDKQGYDAQGLDADSYDRDGYDKEGYDRAGFDRNGRDRTGKAHPWWTPDASGYYADGFDQYGFDRDGYDGAGRDRWGFDRQGSNERGWDREGYNREGYDPAYLDRERYNQAGYDGQGFDRLGYNMHGQDRSGYSITGYDKDGYDKAGVDRWGRDRNNRDARTGRQYKTPPHNKSGFDKEGYDRWGFHRDTGLTADGRNYAGWVYDPKTKRCQEPASPANPAKPANPATLASHPRSMPHSIYQDGRGAQWQRPKWQTRVEWDPSVAPRWDPRAPMPWEEYAKVNGVVSRSITGALSAGASSASSFSGAYGSGMGTGASAQEAVRRSYEARFNPQPNLEQRWQSGEHARAKYDPMAASGGVQARCPHCGQFTGCKSHQCPAFGKRPVMVYTSGLARREGQPDYLRTGDEYSDRGVHADTRQTMDGCLATPNAYGPFANGHGEANPRRAAGVEERDPRYSNGGYDRPGYDEDDLDRFGRDRRGRDEEGYDREGYDWLGRDRDGYDRRGHDRNGYNRAGVKRPRSLHDLAGDYATAGMEGDVLANEGVRRLYSQVASSLAGKPRQVVFQEGGGFATDMQGTIYLDPYPLGRDAPPVYNAAVVMEGLQHEMGHELETPLDTFKRILEIGASPDPVEGLDGGRHLVKEIYNIVEDGRMERRISQLPGVAEYLAVGCKLQPRWDEKVGEGLPLSHEVQGALLYEALPFYQVRPEVLDAMSPRARALFEELRPLVHRGVFGGPHDAYEASVQIARRLQEEGVTAPDEQLRIPTPAFFFFAGVPGDGDGDDAGDSGSGGGAAGEGGVSVAGAPVRAPISAGVSAAYSDATTGANVGSGAGSVGRSVGTGSSSGTPGAQQANGAGASQNGGNTAEASGTKDQEQSGRGHDGGHDTGHERQGTAATQPTQAQQVQWGKANRSGTAGSASRRANTEGGDGAQSPTSPSRPSQPQKVNGPKSETASAASTRSSMGGTELRDPNMRFSDADARRVLDELERDLAEAVESDIRRQSRVEVLGRNLHKPIGARQDAEQVYRDAQGRVRSAPVSFPGLPSGDPALSRLQRRRSTHRVVARQLARYLENVQDVAEETVNFQSKGKLDRHRFAAAMKDAPDVYRRRVEVQGSGFALSVAVDVSGSMGKEMKSGALCDAAMVLSDACEEMSMPYEVRSFSGRTYQYKAMDDAVFSLDRAAMLINGEGGGTNMAQTAGLASTSLLARPERNKLFVSLTDGDLGDHDSTMRQMEQARRDGVLTFGIFLSRGGYVNRERMDQIYGKANWTVINSIQEMPRAVGHRIALLMRRAR